jgi:hypothetical protein
MKHLKLFEEREEFFRSSDYKYLNKEETSKLTNFVERFILDNNVIDNIKNLKLDTFISYDFYYNDIWISEVISKGMYGEKTNIYGACDKFCNQHFHTRPNVPSIRNSLADICEDFLYSMGIDRKLDKKLIEIFEEKPNKYEKYFKRYKDNIPNNVKDACKYMLSANKYNL